ncbi:MAG: TrkH family potassium uptake protein [Planctomycetota bacterium]
MNYAQTARLLGGFTLFFCGVLLVPLLTAVGESKSAYDTVVGFAATMGIGIALAGACLMSTRKRKTGQIFRREGLLIVGLAWLTAGVLGGLPFLISGAIGAPTDALFESVSGLTTTGATVLGSADHPTIESLPKSLLLWRSVLQWVGGTGVILVFTVLLPAMGLTGKNLLDSESVGVSSDERPRMQEQARLLFRIYLGLTAACAICYMTCGMGAFDALCHSFTTMATGGFSTKNQSLGAFDSVGIEITSTVFMFLAGVNFVFMLSVARSLIQKERPEGNREFLAYTRWTVVMIVIVSAVLWFWGREVPDPALGRVNDYDNPLLCLRHASFQVVSMITSTGFCTTDFQNWPNVALALVLFCMLVGGSTGSTAGGLKIYRLLVCLKLTGYAMRRFVRPRTVEKLRLGDEVLPNALISAVLTLVLLWGLLICAGTLVLSFDTRLDFLSALSTSVSATGCTGPGLSTVLPPGEGFALAYPDQINVGPYGGYGALEGYAQLWLCFQMIAGRLEILAPLVLFLPAFWRK